MSVFSPKIVTLNIESTEVRILIMRGRSVEKWGSVSLASGLVKEGLIADPSAVGQVIRQIVSDFGVKGKDVIASLSGFQSIQRFPNMPKLSAQMTAEALLREAKRAMPVALEQLYLSWQLIGEGGDTQSYFLLGIPRNMMDAEVLSIRQGGVTPTTMDLKPLALARMVNREEALIMDIEADSADIVVVSAGQPAIMRTLTMHSDYPLGKRIHDLIEEFERTLEFHDSSHPDRPLSRVTPLFITGGLAVDPEVVDTITAGVQYKVEALVSPLEAPQELPMAQYAVNIGLALKKVAFDRHAEIPNLNILPEGYRPRRLSTKQAVLVPSVVAGLAFLFPLYQVTNSSVSDVSRAQSELETINQQIQVRQLENKKAREVEDAMILARQRTEGLIGQLQAMSAERVDIHDDLRAVAVEALPPGAIITSASVQGDKVTLSGTADSYETAFKYAYALRQIGRFATVWVSSMTESTESVSFNIVVTGP